MPVFLFRLSFILSKELLVTKLLTTAPILVSKELLVSF